VEIKSRLRHSLARGPERAPSIGMSALMALPAKNDQVRVGMIRFLEIFVMRVEKL
jgi:hypothetical protein